MATYEVNVEDVEPMSRTYQYRKVMKPMLERKRRARINKCLDELKDLMVGALQSEGESITKLEKADVLELTVRHLRKLKQHHALTIPAQNHAHEKFRAGFGHCATEVRRFVQAVPGVDIHVSGRLMNHLGQWMNQLEKTSTTIGPKPMSPLSPSSSPSIISVSIPPRVYTPPASPEVKPSPQPVALNLKTAHSSSGGVIFTSKAYSAATLPPTVATSSSSVVMPIPTLPTSYVPVRSPSFGSVEAAKSTGIKVEVPQGSPVWRPWSA